jgi:hypothetical protein
VQLLLGLGCRWHPAGCILHAVDCAIHAYAVASPVVLTPFASPCLQMIFVPPGYSFGADMYKMDEVKAGSSWGAATYAGGQYCASVTCLRCRSRLGVAQRAAIASFLPRRAPPPHAAAFFYKCW